MKDFKKGIAWSYKEINTYSDETITVNFDMSNVTINGLNIPNDEFEKIILEYNRRIKELEEINK